jgi:hypothetical protein
LHRRAIKRGERLIDGRQDAASAGQQKHAMFRERCTGGATYEERTPKRLLQAPHLEADGRLGPPDMTGSGSEALRVAYRDEGLQQVEIHGGHKPRE